MDTLCISIAPIGRGITGVLEREIHGSRKRKVQKFIKRGIHPRPDLVSEKFEAMSELRRSQRLQQATDFSIARILRAEEPNSSSSSSSSSYSGYPSEDRVPRLPNNCACCPQDGGSSLITPMMSTREDREDHPPGREFDKRVNIPRIIVQEEGEGKISTQGSSQGIFQTGCDLPWIHCTRYRPPRLPKRSSAGKVSKRRPGKHPRIPFTPFQLEILEDKYKKGAYLARRDVVQLSLILRLPQSRVKIWFQNRRARERRESLQSGVDDSGISEKEVNNV